MLNALLLSLILLHAPSPAAAVQKQYDAEQAGLLVPMLREVLRFPTLAGNPKAQADQKAWLHATAARLGFGFRDAGTVAEVELTGPPGSPVLGLIVHGDVTALDEAAWSAPPFAGLVRDGYVLGRGAADDKGPLVQALLAMKALQVAGIKRTHTIRLLVGSDEESGSSDMQEYLKGHAPPDYSLVLDSAFPVVVGEKAWNTLTVTADPRLRVGGRKLPYSAASLDAGIVPSIVPDRAVLVLTWTSGAPSFRPLIDRLKAKPLPAGTRLETQVQGETLTVTVRGRSAHSGVNIEGGRNALFALAHLMEQELAPGGIDDLLAFARMAGSDLHGAGLGLGPVDALWDAYDVNVATVKPAAADAKLSLTINIRRIPPRTGAQLKAHLEKRVADFNARTGAQLLPSGFYDDEPLAFDPEAKLVKRLLVAYRRATGQPAKPAISGGGTYAKRFPNAIAFGMWFPDKPYPGHDVDERVLASDLQRGAHVLVEALVDLATAPKILAPFAP
jgi:predicted dipeptidase